MQNELKNDELYTQYQIEIGKPARYVPLQYNNCNIWRCVCGKLNSGETCSNCFLQREKVFNEYNTKQLSNKVKLRYENEAAKLREEENKKRKRFQKKTKVFLGISAVVMVAILFIFWIVPDIIAPAVQYNKGVETYEQGNYEEAIEIFSGLKNYKDSSDLLKASKYNYADQLQKKSEYILSLKQFEMIIGYSDSSYRVKELQNIIFSKGVYAHSLKNYSDALGWFEVIPANYKQGDRTKVDFVADCELAIEYSDILYTLENAEIFIKNNFSGFTKQIDRYLSIREQGEALTGKVLSDEKQYMVELYDLYKDYKGTYYNTYSDYIEAKLVFNYAGQLYPGHFYIELVWPYDGKEYVVGTMSEGRLACDYDEYVFESKTELVDYDKHYGTTKYIRKYS